MEEKAIDNGSRRERKKEETRQRIIDVAMSLFHKNGIAATTMEQIADGVDVSKVTLYNYFPVKEAIVNAFMQACNQTRREEEIPKLIEGFPDTKTRLMAVFRNSQEWMKENRDIYKAYLGYRMQNMFEAIRDPSTRSGFEGVLAKIICAGQDAGEIRRDMSADILARHFEIMSVSALMPWFLDPENYSLEENLGLTIELFFHGAKP